MSDRAAKFCTDRNKVRWILLEGVITRRTPQEDPTQGTHIPIEQVSAVEKTSITRTHRSALAKPVTIFALLLLALTAWLATLTWIAAVPTGLIGLLLLIWGGKRLSGQTEVQEAYQIVASGTNPSEWLVVGSHLEVMGFVNGVRAEAERLSQEKAAARN